MARIAALSADLMLASRVRASLEAAGHDVEQGTALEGVGDVNLIVADLDAVQPEELSDVAVPVIGFYPHTDVALKDRADSAGIDLVVPRSRMARELPELVDRLLAQG